MGNTSQKKQSSLITLFARKEKTSDQTSIQQGLSEKMDTVIYKDPLCTVKKAVYPWFGSNCPDRRNKFITLNCWRWEIQWVGHQPEYTKEKS